MDSSTLIDLSSNSTSITSEERAANRNRERQALKGFLSEKKRLLSITIESSSASNLSLLNSQVNVVESQAIQLGIGIVGPKGHSGYDERSRDSPPHSPKQGEFGLGISKETELTQSHWATGTVTTMRKTRWEGAQDIVSSTARWVPPTAVSPSSPAISLPSPTTIDALLFGHTFLPPVSAGSAKPLPPTPPEIAQSRYSDLDQENQSRSNNSNWIANPVSPHSIPFSTQSSWTNAPTRVIPPTTPNLITLSPSPTIRVLFNPLTPPLLPLPSLPSQNSISSLSSLSISLSPAREFFSSANQSNRGGGGGGNGNGGDIDLLNHSSPGTTSTSMTSRGTFSSRSNQSISSSSSAHSILEEKEQEQEQEQEEDEDSFYQPQQRNGSKLLVVLEPQEDEYEVKAQDSDNSDAGKSHVDFSSLLSSPLPKRRFSKQRRPSLPPSPSILSPTTSNFRFSNTHSSSSASSSGIGRNRSISQSPRGSTSQASSGGEFEPRSRNSSITSGFSNEENPTVGSFEPDLLEESGEEEREEGESESDESEIDVDASLETLAWRSGVMGRAGRSSSSSNSEASDDDEFEKREGKEVTPARKGSNLRIDVKESLRSPIRRSSSKTSLDSSSSTLRRSISNSQSAYSQSNPTSPLQFNLSKSPGIGISKDYSLSVPSSPARRRTPTRSSSASSVPLIQLGISYFVSSQQQQQQQQQKQLGIGSPIAIIFPGGGPKRSSSMISIPTSSSKIPGPTTTSRLPIPSSRPSSVLSSTTSGNLSPGLGLGGRSLSRRTSNSSLLSVGAGVTARGRKVST